MCLKNIVRGEVEGEPKDVVDVAHEVQALLDLILDLVLRGKGGGRGGRKKIYANGGLKNAKQPNAKKNTQK